MVSWFCVALCGAALCGAVRCFVALCCSALRCAALVLRWITAFAMLATWRPPVVRASQVGRHKGINGGSCKLASKVAPLQGR